ncbi:MAG: tetratricopeptide repeat protein, partial [Balneolaceae bacterium]|nr:tetratricopeptide repeat protein [Balneolaceae bacterium]
KGHLSEEKSENMWKALLFRPDYIELLETELYIKRIIEEQDATERNGSLPVNSGSSSQKAISFSWKWLAAAASVAILIISISFMQGEQEKSLQELMQGEINIVEHFASPEVMRSQDTEITAIDSLLNLGFKAAISGDVEKALGFYNNVIENYGNAPNVSMAYLNLGIIQYNRENYREAATAFDNAIQKVRDDRILEEKAYWYLGNSYVHLNRLTEGREAIIRAYRMNGIYQNPAQRLLKKLNEELGISDPEY